MNFSSSYYSYKSTGAFSKLATDYVEANPFLKQFVAYEPNRQGILESIKNRGDIEVDRNLLLRVLKDQYNGFTIHEKISKNIDLLQQSNTFTICTAHQPNVLTGPLYFIYKIIHVIKIADELNVMIPENHFVPVYYMGSEDADFNELGSIFHKGIRYQWNTSQQGAVGRMTIDDSFLDFLNEVKSIIEKEPFGKEVVSMLENCYQLGETIQQATLKLVHQLFGRFGLLVIIPDHPLIKKKFSKVIEDEINFKSSHQILQNTLKLFSVNYTPVVTGRSLNLFYLKDNIRERIEETDGMFKIVNTSWVFTKEELMQEVSKYPERFSPNVVLRPLLQEMILPNVIFVGGGAELGYWMELKNIFEHHSVAFPVLLLRNSFLIINEKNAKKIADLKMEYPHLFWGEIEILDILIKNRSGKTITLAAEKKALEHLYLSMGDLAKSVDVTLEKHVAALLAKAQKKIDQLEKKIWRAERKKYQKELAMIKEIKLDLFPQHTLQERKDNFFIYAAHYGWGIVDEIYKASTSLEQQFCMLVAE